MLQNTLNPVAFNLITAFTCLITYDCDLLTKEGTIVNN